MPEVLKGNTATMTITNNAAVKIKIEDQDHVWVQWISTSEIEEPVLCDIEELEDEEGSLRTGFYYKESGSTFFLDDFCRDNIWPQSTLGLVQDKDGEWSIDPSLL